MSNDKKKKTILIVVAILISLLLLLLIIFGNIKNKEKNSINNSISSNENANKEKDVELIKKLKKVDEAERIRIYLGTYFKYIEKKEYESAYNLLYPEFKATYFPKLEDFKKYIEDENFPEMLSIEYNDISLKGSYYVVDIIIRDFLNKRIRYNKSGKFIVQENDYNDYFISFQK